MKRKIYLLSLIAIWFLSLSAIVIRKNTSGIVVQDISSPAVVLTNKLSDIPEALKFDKSIERYMRRWRVKGLTVGVMKNNKLVYAKGYGYADVEKEIACEAFSEFRLASMSKLITGIAVMKLIDDGYLSLSDKVFGEGSLLGRDYPKYRDKRVSDITVEHLLRHEGGFTTPIGDPMFKIELVELGLDVERPISNEQTIEYALSRKLGFKPGRSRKYSNVGYLLLSKVIEKASGKSYEDYVTQKILIPAGCYNTHLAKNLYEDRRAHEVKYYSGSKEDFIPAYDGSGDILPKQYGGNDVVALQGAGAWVSTVGDMLRLALSIDGKNASSNFKDVISAKSVSKMQTPLRGRMSIGWASVNGGKFVRTGSFCGTSTIMSIDPDGTSWIVLSNTSSYIGYRLNNNFKSMMRNSLKSLPKFAPDRNLFDEDYIEDFMDNQ